MARPSRTSWAYSGSWTLYCPTVLLVFWLATKEPQERLFRGLMTTQLLTLGVKKSVLDVLALHKSEWQQHSTFTSPHLTHAPSNLSFAFAV
eukprot:2198866-Amphidinium_carterae.1